MDKDKPNYVNVQITEPYREKLRKITQIMNNSMNNTAENLIDREWARMFSEPHQFVTVDEAVEAAESV